ncbi:MAG: NUDIX domain-containing protein [Anaerolineaceae bacterium]|nr:NUDIX domain-containing protein [Anaerolineaceae bacterium]MCB9098662.1 NUDIX domain-containing protein [Anaerolineales bacterium]
MTLKPWKTLARAKVLDYGKWLVIEKHTIELPDGRIIDDWPWVISPDYINVIAVTEDRRFMLFRQVKYCTDETSLAPVGGYLDPNENALDAAKRELFEETGYEAADWISLGQYCVDGNRGAGTAYLFLAQGAHQVAEPDADDLEEQELLFLDQAEVEQALLGGEFKVLSWATTVALALRVLDKAR